MVRIDSTVMISKGITNDLCFVECTIFIEGQSNMTRERCLKSCRRSGKDAEESYKDNVFVQTRRNLYYVQP